MEEQGESLKSGQSSKKVGSRKDDGSRLKLG